MITLVCVCVCVFYWRSCLLCCGLAGWGGSCVVGPDTPFNVLQTLTLGAFFLSLDLVAKRLSQKFSVEREPEINVLRRRLPFHRVKMVSAVDYLVYPLSWYAPILYCVVGTRRAA